MAIDLSKLGRSKKGLQFDAIGQAMADGAGEFIKRTKANLEKDGTNATNALSQSIAPSIKQTGFKYRLTIFAEDYWRSIDIGGKVPAPKYSRTPFTVNGIKFNNGYKDIIKWIIAKPLNIPRHDLKRAQFFIGRHIADPSYRRRGTKFMSRELDPFLKRLNADLTIALKRDVEIELQGILKPLKPGR